MGSILAPNAVFDTGFNVDGNIVAKEVTIGSENHRWELDDASLSSCS